MIALYITHPEVDVDPSIPPPYWRLSARGRARAEAFAGCGVVPPHAAIFSSTEPKARALADILAAPGGQPVRSDPAMNEADRSATGYLGQDFAAALDAFYAEPDANVHGWERARDAQARIVSAVRSALRDLPQGIPAVFCGHGTVGTLLKCRLAGRAIARAEDQRLIAHAGGGNIIAFSLDPAILRCEWTAMEDFQPGWDA